MDLREKTAVSAPHQIIMQDRHTIELTGVSDVDNFDDAVVVAYTSLGELTVRGKELHIRQLNVEQGSLSVEGKIDALTYADVSKGGFFSRLLR